MDSKTIDLLTNYILNLPVEYGAILLLRYCRYHTVSEIEELLNVSFVRGKIEYLRRELGERLGIADRLISDISFAKACAKCVCILQIT